VTDAAAIDRLRAIAARLVEREDPDAAWFMTALLEYTSGARHGATFDATLGLRPGTGATSWWELEAQATRDGRIRAIVAKWYPTLSARAAATALVRALARYETSASANGWRHHRADISPPVCLRDTLQADLFSLLKIGSPLGASTIRSALANKTGLFVSHVSGNAPGRPEEPHGSTETDEGLARSR
jgi:hypothetical protein